jgi:hypothetical protein
MLQDAARWGQALNKTVKEFTQAVEKQLDGSAARGFPAPPGGDLDAIITAGQEAKAQLVEANGKIYDIESQVLFDEEALRQKVKVTLARLAMELYRVEIMDALELEQARIDQAVQEQRADVERWLAEIESRQVHIIRDRALVEQSLLVLQKELVATQEATIPLQRTLVEEEYQTALKRLEIINSIYQVLAAEQLVLVAERQKAASLQQVLAAHRIIAALKEEMVPYYLMEADAEQQLAVAVTQEAQAKKQLELLGYERLRLRWSQEDADHLTRAAELDYEVVKAERERAEAALRLAREQAQITIANYRNQVQANIIQLRKALEEEKIYLNLSSHLTRQHNNIIAEEMVLTDELKNLSAELATFLTNITVRAGDEDFTIRQEAGKAWLSINSSDTNSKRIIGG